MNWILLTWLPAIVSSKRVCNTSMVLPPIVSAEGCSFSKSVPVKSVVSTRMMAFVSPGSACLIVESFQMTLPLRYLLP